MPDHTMTYEELDMANAHLSEMVTNLTAIVTELQIALINGDPEYAGELRAELGSVIGALQ